MRENATILVFDDPCPDGLLGLDLAKHLPLGKYTTGIVPVPLTHPLSDDTRKKIYKNGNKTNRLILIDCCLKKFDIIELASYYEQIIICDHHNEEEFKGFVWPENVFPYFNKSLCGSEVFFNEVIKPACPGLKRPLVLDIVKIADLAIWNPEKIAEILGHKNIKSVKLEKPEDLYYILVSALDTSIDFSKSYRNPNNNPLTDLERFQDLSFDEIVAKGLKAYPELKAEAHKLLSNQSYVALDLPGLGPLWANYVEKNILENRFVSTDPPKFHDLTLIGGRRKNGLFYLSIRMKEGGYTERILNAEQMARYLGKTAFRININGEEKIVRGIDGGGRGVMGCCQFDPKVARYLFPVIGKHDRRLKNPPLSHAVIRQDRAIFEINGEQQNHVLEHSQNAMRPNSRSSHYTTIAAPNL